MYVWRSRKNSATTPPHRIASASGDHGKDSGDHGRLKKFNKLNLAALRMSKIVAVISYFAIQIIVTETSAIILHINFMNFNLCTLFLTYLYLSVSHNM